MRFKGAAYILEYATSTLQSDKKKKTFAFNLVTESDTRYQRRLAQSRQKETVRQKKINKQTKKLNSMI